MKKLFFIALFTIGLTTAMSAQSYVTDSQANYSFVIDLQDTSNPIVSVSVGGTTYTETIGYFYPIGNGSFLSHQEIHVGSLVYNFIVEKDASNNILYHEVWVD